MTLDQRVEAIVAAMAISGQEECKEVSSDLQEFSLATVALAVRMLIAISEDIPTAKQTMVAVINDLFLQAERGSEAVN